MKVDKKYKIHTDGGIVKKKTHTKYNCHLNETGWIISRVIKTKITQDSPGTILHKTICVCGWVGGLVEVTGLYVDTS